MKKIIDLSGLGGLSPRYFGDYPYSTDNKFERYLGGENQYAYGIVNPLARFGQLSPANNSFNDITPNGTAIIRATIVDSFYSKPFFLQDKYVHYINDLTSAGAVLETLALTDYMAGTAVGTDLEFYSISQYSPSRRLFLSYKNNTGTGDIATCDTSTLGNGWTDWFSNSFNFYLGANNHKMIIADNGYMYILDGSAVHRVDGTTGSNGTATANVLLFPALFSLVDGVDSNGYLWMGIVRTIRDLTLGTNNTTFSEYCGVYIWDRQTTAFNSKNFIPIGGVKEIKAMFILDNIPGCFTISNKGYAQIRLYNGTEFALEQELGQSAFPRFPDSVAIDGSLIKWLGKDGIFYAYGSPNKGSAKALYMLGDITTAKTESSTFTSGGAILMAGGSPTVSTGENSIPEQYYLSFQDTTYKKLKRWCPNATSIGGGTNSVNSGNFYTMAKFLPKLSMVKSATIFYPKKSFATGATDYNNLDVNFYFNMSSTGWGTTTLKKIADGNRGYKFIPINEPSVNSIQVGLSWKTTNTSLEIAIKPIYCEIDFETKEKLK